MSSTTTGHKFSKYDRCMFCNINRIPGFTPSGPCKKRKPAPSRRQESSPRNRELPPESSPRKPAPSRRQESSPRNRELPPESSPRKPAPSRRQESSPRKPGSAKSDRRVQIPPGTPIYDSRDYSVIFVMPDGSRGSPATNRSLLEPGQSVAALRTDMMRGDIAGSAFFMFTPDELFTVKQTPIRGKLHYILMTRVFGRNKDRAFQFYCELARAPNKRTLKRVFKSDLCDRYSEMREYPVLDFLRDCVAREPGNWRHKYHELAALYQ